MIKYFQQAFKITNENIILTTPLVLFLFLLSIYLGVARVAPENIQATILLTVTIIFMLSAFFAGWFYMVKKAIQLDSQEFIIEDDKAKASFELIKEIPIGVGEYFLSFIGALFVYGIFTFSLLFIGYKVGMHFIGDAGLTANQLREAFTSQEALAKLFSQMSKTQHIKLSAWEVLLLAVVSIYSFLTMFFPAQIVDGVKNPLVAFFKSIGKIFSNFLSTVVLFLYISLINFFVSLINTISMSNQILYFVSMLVYFYFLVYVVVLVFLYYEQELKTKTESNSDSRSDSIGQD